MCLYLGVAGFVGYASGWNPFIIVLHKTFPKKFYVGYWEQHIGSKHYGNMKPQMD